MDMGQLFPVHDALIGVETENVYVLSYRSSDDQVLVVDVHLEDEPPGGPCEVLRDRGRRASRSAATRRRPRRLPGTSIGGPERVRGSALPGIWPHAALRGAGDPKPFGVD